MANYRAEKDGISIHVTPELVPIYIEQGYRIFKPLEQEITNDPEEINKTYTVASYDAVEQLPINNGD